MQNTPSLLRHTPTPHPESGKPVFGEERVDYPSYPQDSSWFWVKTLQIRAVVVEMTNLLSTSPPSPRRPRRGRPVNRYHSTTSATPFRFMDLPLELQRMVLRLAVTTNKLITPYDARVSGKALLHVNRHVSIEASIILYGDNEFMLLDPVEMMRFFDAIGTVNISKLKSVSINIGTGITSSSDTVEERCWLPALRILRESQELQRIMIEFVMWDSLFGDWGTQHVDPDWYATYEIMSARRAVVQELDKFRGIRSVTVTGFPSSPPYIVEYLEQRLSSPR
ncbi:MAG: hypothetical protein M1835_001265 [Candelina submexicana]|nr:MAG: hypothetical protein M1835_001265 [Candelina submexicana]